MLLRIAELAFVGVPLAFRASSEWLTRVHCVHRLPRSAILNVGNAAERKFPDVFLFEFSSRIAPSFDPNFLRISRGVFMLYFLGKQRQLKIHQEPRPFVNAESPTQSKQSNSQTFSGEQARQDLDSATEVWKEEQGAFGSCNNGSNGSGFRFQFVSIALLQNESFRKQTQLYNKASESLSEICHDIRPETSSVSWQIEIRKSPRTQKII